MYTPVGLITIIDILSHGIRVSWLARVKVKSLPSMSRLKQHHYSTLLLASYAPLIRKRKHLPLLSVLLSFAPMLISRIAYALLRPFTDNSVAIEPHCSLLSLRNWQPWWLHIQVLPSFLLIRLLHTTKKTILKRTPIIDRTNAAKPPNLKYMSPIFVLLSWRLLGLSLSFFIEKSG